MTKTKKVSQKKEIVYNVVNSLLAGGLVLFGACSSGPITLESLGIALGTSLLTAIIQFKKYWESQAAEYEYKPAILSFVLP